ncbi:Phage major capsid protein [Rhodovulum sp. P5]|uniref:major head protein n=1 Tax=Rhodovulum phage vB_RhkS_P1 TaxID=1873452 RepID=UPI00080ABC8E|nr:Mu-like prophage major head subunit gpT family protein [Rhodovulum sp. P5]YP_009285924.1 major head protein [Rhodovulum phage vB_RhkS_P1]ANT39910.1 major capsid protein [Rhodovulum phage vB_RhkS_P1]ARE38978.1 Phage major capsid protein [Rhodovulum sp. P5]
MDITAAALAAINTGFNTAFNTRLTGVETTYGRVAMTVKSSSRTEAYPRLSELGPMREWVGERYIERLSTDGFTITNRKFEKTVAVAADDISDDRVGIYAPIVSDMGQTAAELPDVLVWEGLETGFDTAHYDGQFFFDTDHPVVDANGVEQSVSNFQGGTGAAWYLIDDTRVIKPMIFQDRQPATITPKTSLTDDNVFHRDEFLWGAKRRCAAGFGAWQLIYASRQTLNAANYAAARAAMQEMRGHRGRKLNLKPSLLVVSSANEAAARALLKADRVDGGDFNIWHNSADLLVVNRLTI